MHLEIRPSSKAKFDSQNDHLLVIVRCQLMENPKKQLIMN